MRIIILFLLLHTYLHPAFSGKEYDKIPEYNITLKFIPVSGRIEGRLKIINPTDSVFRLAGSLKVSRVVANKKDISSRVRKATGREQVNTWSVDCIPKEIIIEWEGSITPGDMPKQLTNFNMIGDSLVELTDEYNGIVKSSDTRLSILETPGDSWEGNINRYYKPTLLLKGLRLKYGDDRFFSFLRSLDSSFVSSGGATTKVFLEVSGKILGAGARNYMEEGLNRKQWISENKNTEKQIVPSDTLYVGKWSGKLTQFGSTNEFVLHLKISSGELIPSLDSPDQNAFGIPATDLSIKGDTISYSVGAASASFNGILNRSKMLIDGTWKQRGAKYPLVLIKSE